MSTVVLRNGVLADDPARPVADLVVVDGVIAGRGGEAEVPEGAAEIDCTGLTILPGAIDVLGAIADPRRAGAPADDLATGTLVAARGGVTTVVCPVRPMTGESPSAALADVARRASGIAVVDWAAAVRVSGGASADEVAALTREPGFAALLLDLDGEAVPSPIALAHLAVRADVPLVVRSAGHGAGPVQARRLRALADAVALAGGNAHVVPVASAEALAGLEDGLLTGSASLAHVAIAELEEGFQVAPPLPGASGAAALLAALADRRLEGVASCHFPSLFDEAPEWFGIGTLEVFWPALLTAARGRIDLHDLVEAVCAAPARRFGLRPHKGSLLAGADGDVVAVDLDAEWTVDASDTRSRGTLEPWDGRTLTGRVVHVLSRGVPVVADGEAQFGAGRGRPAV